MNALELQAFDLGWDYATFGINVPESANKMFCDGYRAFGAEKNKTVRTADRFVRKWLQIRFGAFARAKSFSTDVTPEYIQSITPVSGECPVTGHKFTYGTGQPTDWSVDRANNNRGYVRGNILIINQGANAAKRDRSLVEIRSLSQSVNDQDGLTPIQWGKLAILIEPAFGDHDDEVSPIPYLFGQPVALGMPVSPLASFQVALSRALIVGWDRTKRDDMMVYVGKLHDHVCKTKAQRKGFDRLINEVLRRSIHIQSYAEVWGAPRIQKRLYAFVNSLGSQGLTRLISLQAVVLGNENTNIV